MAKALTDQAWTVQLTLSGSLGLGEIAVLALREHHSLQGTIVRLLLRLAWEAAISAAASGDHELTPNIAVRVVQTLPTGGLQYLQHQHKPHGNQGCCDSWLQRANSSGTCNPSRWCTDVGTSCISACLCRLQGLCWPRTSASGIGFPATAPGSPYKLLCGLANELGFQSRGHGESEGKHQKPQISKPLPTP